MRNAAMNSGQSGFYTKPNSNAILDFFSNIADKINISDESGYSKQLKARNPRYFTQGKKQEVKLRPKKEVTVTAPVLKPKTQISVPTKQEVKPTTPTKQVTTVNNQKTTVKPKEEIKTAPKQTSTNKETYLPKKPKGEVNMRVKLFQKMLQDEGFNIKNDGMWGPKTQEAFDKLQANKANYTIAMEKFNQMEEALQLKRIEPTIKPVQLNSKPMSRLSQDSVPFVEESVYLKKGGKMEFIYLKKGGKINGKPNPNDGDENAIPTKEEGGVDMNPNFKKLKPKQTTKPTPIYKPKAKTEKVVEKKKGGKMRKKCSCGCAMKISKNAKGGLIESCACGCRTKK